VLLLAACGRVGFDARAIDDIDAAPDAFQLACSVKPATSQMLDVSGQTFEYTSFNNTTQPVGNVPVTLRADGMTIGTTTSGTDGAYQITYATGGVSRPLVIEYAPVGYFTTTVFTDSVVDMNIAGANMARWQLGDAPVWSQSAMVSVYTAANETLDGERGTLNVAVRDCAGNGIENVTVQIDPPPLGRLAYQDVDGTPSPTRTKTIGPYNHALAYRAQPGRTTITASTDGRTFATTIVDVRAGNHNTLAIVRATN
jgi:hypothetical protein